MINIGSEGSEKTERLYLMRYEFPVDASRFSPPVLNHS
jgi:hypothetical protein